MEPINPKLTVALHDLSSKGQNLDLNVNELLETYLAEFQVNCKLLGPVKALVEILPLDSGCLIRGKLTGKLILCCSRCAEDVPYELSWDFEEFESLPNSFLAKDAEENQSKENSSLNSMVELASDESRITLVQGQPLLDLGAILWEEFLLAQPLSPLCKPNCQGLCPNCGANLNSETCRCQKDEGDPRLAIFRKLIVKSK